MRDDGQMTVCVRARAVLLGDSHAGERVWGYTGGRSVEQQASQKTPKTLATKLCNKEGYHDIQQTQLGTVARDPCEGSADSGRVRRGPGGLAWTGHHCA